MMRILFSRFSLEGIMKMFRVLWPIIFTELIQNIENNKRNQNIDLEAESFKFIELLSLATIEEFTLYEWIFIKEDYFNFNIVYMKSKELFIYFHEKNENNNNIIYDIINEKIKSNKVSNFISDSGLRGLYSIFSPSLFMKMLFFRSGQFFHFTLLLMMFVALVSRGDHNI